MEPIHSPLSGYRINEYLLVLDPHEEVSDKVQKIREDFATRYKTAQNRSRSHITLVRFTALEMMEEKTVHRLEAIAMGITPFKVELKDYGSFPSHSIFINVVSKLPVQDVVKQLKAAQRLMKLNADNKPHFIEEPHLPVASKLRPWQYEQGWLDFSHRQFTSRFIAGGMLLLRRKAGEKSAYQVARRFDFLNLPVTTRQGNLFV